MNSSGKIAYLMGLLDGQDIDKNSKEGKIFTAIADALNELSEEIRDNSVEIMEVEELAEILDKDLGELEETVMDMMDDEDDFDDDFYSEVCPNCGAELTLEDDELLEGVAYCPCCDTEFEIDCGCDCDCDCDDDCDCGCDCE